MQDIARTRAHVDNNIIPNIERAMSALPSELSTVDQIIDREDSQETRQVSLVFDSSEEASLFKKMVQKHDRAYNRLLTSLDETTSTLNSNIHRIKAGNQAKNLE